MQVGTNRSVGKPPEQGPRNIKALFRVTEGRLAKLGEPVRLDLERTAATAGGLHLRVVELEAGTFQRLDEIHFGAIQV